MIDMADCRAAYESAAAGNNDEQSDSFYVSLLTYVESYLETNGVIVDGVTREHGTSATTGAVVEKLARNGVAAVPQLAPSDFASIGDLRDAVRSVADAGVDEIWLFVHFENEIRVHCSLRSQ